MVFHYRNRIISKILSMYKEIRHENKHQVQRTKEEGWVLESLCKEFGLK